MWCYWGLFAITYANISYWKFKVTCLPSQFKKSGQRDGVAVSRQFCNSPIPQRVTYIWKLKLSASYFLTFSTDCSDFSCQMHVTSTSPIIYGTKIDNPVYTWQHTRTRWGKGDNSWHSFFTDCTIRHSFDTRLSWHIIRHLDSWRIYCVWHTHTFSGCWLWDWPSEWPAPARGPPALPLRHQHPLARSGFMASVSIWRQQYTLHIFARVVGSIPRGMFVGTALQKFFLRLLPRCSVIVPSEPDQKSARSMVCKSTGALFSTLSDLSRNLDTEIASREICEARAWLLASTWILSSWCWCMNIPLVILWGSMQKAVLFSF